MKKKHNEDSRVKIPALIHFSRLGYEYISLKDNSNIIDKDTNIFIDIFRLSINEINKIDLSFEEVSKIVEDFKAVLNNDDLGKQFYNYLVNGYKGIKLIDFENIKDNNYNVVTELSYKNDFDEFRPDITILVNGIPVSFMEVKKPNNKEGIQAEYSRINTRFNNRKFKRFINITQFMVFSNNSEYDDEEEVPLEGAFYATSNYEKLFFNHFREEQPEIYNNINDIKSNEEIKILKDNNLISLLGSQEYKTNISFNSPTNKIVTSLYTKSRILFILEYAFAYLEKTNSDGIIKIEKHIMRYPQLFATKAIKRTLDSGLKKGIIWHTQGSGKTALTYYNIKYLKEYYRKKGIITKFYFIVDRLSLLEQASEEFNARGMRVEKIGTKEQFQKNLATNKITDNSGEDLITVVNIQKFSKEAIATLSEYNVNIQRIYFIDEGHRSYKAEGEFLANLVSSDRESIHIALTGTPLIGNSNNSKFIFGDYIHKYYYNKSIIDRYTLRLVRQGIETTYRKNLENEIQHIKIKDGIINKNDVYAHPAFVKSLVKYITNDFETSRLVLDEETIGGMIVCDSSKQAKEIHRQLCETSFSSALILSDEGSKEIRNNLVNDFKLGKIDFLVVFNMLLTGFDAPRLKKLYIGRVVKDHSLLQTLTRVNRPYKKLRYGYVVDFADIQEEFEKTNKKYLKELKQELGEQYFLYNNIFKTSDEIKNELDELENELFMFETSNLEIFSQQISALDDINKLKKLRKVLDTQKSLYNLAKLFGYEKLIDNIPIENVKLLYNEVNNRINLVNFKENLNSNESITNLLNITLEDIQFNFKKISESEMIIADKYTHTLEKTRKAASKNKDTKDKEYVILMEELKKIFKKKNIEELTSEEMKNDISILEELKSKIERKNLEDAMLTTKYSEDSKYMRVHKRLKESKYNFASDIVIFKIVNMLKSKIDSKIETNERILTNTPYFLKDMFPIIKSELENNNIAYSAEQIKYIAECIIKEYLSEKD